jgi:acylphosphatase
MPAMGRQRTKPAAGAEAAGRAVSSARMAEQDHRGAMRRVRARVSGRVQGVYFRASTVDQAERMGLSGWVRNCSDGTVELEAQGRVGAVEALVAWCRRGPPAAAVAAVAVDELAPVDGERGFRVRR